MKKENKIASQIFKREAISLLVNENGVLFVDDQTVEIDDPGNYVSNESEGNEKSYDESGEISCFIETNQAVDSSDDNAEDDLNKYADPKRKIVVLFCDSRFFCHNSSPFFVFYTNSIILILKSKYENMRKKRKFI